MTYFGIDLGTTNSLIARYVNGAVTVFKNPVGLKETLPSVVAFRGGRLLIGDKAREFLDKDPLNVVGAFKRRMGTTDTYWFESVSQTKTPIELSAMVLQELKTFVQTGELVESVVITIPASFDTVQANATRQAGLMAGFREVVLLQEPVAASLAFVNQGGMERFDGKRWLVYDLGGGTFDVALVKTEHGEMTIVDHEGDNFLGGVDFDSGLVDLFVIPHLQQLTGSETIETELKSHKGAYNALYYQLMKRAEDAKITLSAQADTDIEFDFTTPDGQYHDVVLPILRTQFEDSIRPAINRTVEMIRAVISRNKLTAADIDCVLMVGGSTYTPLVRQLVGQSLGIPVSTNIDPTNAIAVGAAHYAGTRMSGATKPTPPTVTPENDLPTLHVKTAYQRVSQDTQEVLLAEIDGPAMGLFYRITRTDSGYDSGLKPAQGRISEDLPLLPDTNNTFDLRLYNAQNTLVHTESGIIIRSGRYGILGQPLPHDICIEVDDSEAETTRLAVVFEKNAVLPLRKVLTRTLSKTIRRGSGERITINVLEGPRTVAPYVNLSIGSIEISGSQLPVDLIKGSDVEIILEMTESRELRITAFLMMTEQEFSAQFSPTSRHLSISKLTDDLRAMTNQADSELRYTTGTGDVADYRYMADLQTELCELLRQAESLSPDDVTDRKYQLDDRKRQLARQFDGLSRDNQVLRLKESYFERKNECRELLDQYGSAGEQAQFNEIAAEETRLMRVQDTAQLKQAIDQFDDLLGRLRARSPEIVAGYFNYLSQMNLDYRDPMKAQQLIAKGNEHLKKQRWSNVVTIINQLSDLLPNEKRLDNPLNGTGLR